ncbi:hypothetical protein QFC21_001508 [Naganishia friedmannii]|uniref:Uncharacterized protein n=1 Tax=Naganishia friedmannii TaxID=89922 RepID=A0ACC2W5J7_9TREE|nr:hypothetical protein QFC21_001508 [Naganishia friedmannii]
MTADQCQVAFPHLYQEADRAQGYFADRGGISKADVDLAEEEGNARVVILNNTLFVKAFRGGYNSRTQASLATIYRTLLTSPQSLPDVEFVIQTGDAGGGTVAAFALSRKAEQEHLWLMPDFGFFSWPEPGISSYLEIRQETMDRERDIASGARRPLDLVGWQFEEDIVSEVKIGQESHTNIGLDEDVTDTGPNSWSGKIPKLIWRGVPQVEVRHELLRAAEGQPWSDVQSLDWGRVNDEDKKTNGGDLKTMPEHCDYRYLMQTEGWGYSGRLKYLQQCKSVVIAHPMEHIQHYHHLFDTNPSSPSQNMIEVARPLEEHLPALMEHLIAEGDERAQLVAENSWRDLREGYISPAANECYFRYAIRAYAAVQAFKPDLEGRSASYESFLLTGQTQWQPHR